MKRDIDISAANADEAGRGSAEWVVRAGAGDGRSWPGAAPACAALSRYGIAHVGVARAFKRFAGYRPSTYRRLAGP
jgi:hypothetical protein